MEKKKIEIVEVGPRDGFQFAARRHQHDAAHLKFMGAGEPLDGTVAIIISCCFPTVLVAQMTVGAGARFCHSEGHGTWSEMEVTTMSRAYAGLYIARIPLCDGPWGVTTCQGTHNANQNQQRFKCFLLHYRFSFQVPPC